MGPTIGETGPGVLARITLEVLHAASPGLTSLGLQVTEIVDSNLLDIPRDQELGGLLTIDVSCPPPPGGPPTPAPMPTPMPTPTPVPPILPPIGDVDSDGETTIVDGLLCAQRIVGLVGPAEIDETVAELDDDGELTIVDCLLIAQLAVGIIV